MSKIGSGFNESMMAQLRDMQSQMQHLNNKAANESDTTKGPSFADHLRDSVTEVNETQKVSDKMAVDLATGKSQNLHETMLAASKAELTFNLMVQVRNKILEAYQEVMRMQV